ncbi:putative porin [Novosphingobium sp. MMS21-SN21R]|uniref:putative porin n=1 Tax=Novosphingobium sp. MMS21-SN21R TaxID=2969298 RepID=UPI002887EAEC|nr:putative porin [Novosphingobium sp. MMS21-SN21R]MDT0508415.1 putative porin [Novosphingobium sp. MMS21-SN21R]
MLNSSEARMRKIVVIGLLATAAMPFAARAQDAATTVAPSDSSMVNLVRLLVEQKVLSADKGEALMRQALSEAEAARAVKPAPSAAALAPPAAGAVRVPYIPETVRDQIKAELRNDVLAQAKQEGWATRDQAAPDWTRRLTLSGDLRVRSQSNLFSKANSDQIFDFARINAGGPYDVAGATFPFLNTRKDKVNLLGIRARLNLNVKVSDRVEAGFQLATGDDNSPIATNNLLGGGFGKRDIWLQEAWVELRPTDWASVTLGRMHNPFVSTGMVFDEDLAFDGVAVELDSGTMISDSVAVKVRGGAFPLDYGDANYLSTQTTKPSFPQKYLFSGQVELDADVSDDLNVQLAAGYHHFTNVQGDLSEPCLVGTGVVDCSTDGLRPFFLRKGNTLSYLRQLATVGGAQLTSLPQYFGLTFDYRLVDLNLNARFALDDELEVLAKGNYVRNIGFRRGDICRNGVLGEPFNNGGTTGLASVPSLCATTGPKSTFLGGNEAYQGMLRVGYRNPEQPGQWQFEAGYRYLETDAVLDSFTDSEFHIGGTNYKGYFLGGVIGIFPKVTFGAHWMSGNEIAGDPLAIDVLQVEINAKF